MNTLDKFNEALPVFNYSVLSDEEKLKTLENEKRLDEIFNKYRPEIGEVLYDQQQVLANHHKGVFAEWYKSKGFKRWKVYDYINKYKYVLRISEDPEKLEMFDDIPSSLQSEMAKPSAIPEVNQKVFEGDITAHKDYKEIEMHYQQQLKQKEELIESLGDSMHDFEVYAKELENENERLKNQKPQEPRVIEKEIIPDDYEDLKRTTNYLTKRNEHLEKEHQDLLNQRKEVNEKSQKYDELTNAIQQSQGELNRVQQKIADYDGLHKVLKEGNALLAKLSVLVYSDLSDAVANDTLVKNELDILLSRFLKLNEDITKKITNNMIIEGEIIND